MGGALYIIGHAGDIRIIRSTDNGESWSAPAKLTEGENWMSACCNVLHLRGNIYLAMERIGAPGWQSMEPVLLRAGEGADLFDRASWTFSDTLRALDTIDMDKTAYTPIPFYDINRDRGAQVIPGRLGAGAPGWLETNVTQIYDPSHIWHDPSGHTFHLFRAPALRRNEFLRDVLRPWSGTTAVYQWYWRKIRPAATSFFCRCRADI